jgi:hypothetical protein
MSTILSGLSRTVLIATVCVASTVALAKHPQRTQKPPEAISSVLLSDDERIGFCTQMHLATTPDERRAIVQRLRDTLVPRAKAQNIALPAWLLQPSATQDYGSSGDSLPGLSCGGGTAKAGARSSPPANEPLVQKTPKPTSEPLVQKAPNRETAEAPKTPNRALAEVPKPPTREPAEVPKPPNPEAAEVPKPPNREAPEAQKTAGRETVETEKPPAPSAPPNAPPGGLPVRNDHGIPYVTGGVGQDEAAALRKLPGYNMRATFTTRNGEYLSSVVVQVSRSDGTVVFAASSDGPYLFAKLPPGHYRVVASVNDVARSREIYVPSRGGTHFTLVWPSSFASTR